MNSIIIMGRLTSDPELKTTQSQKAVTSFTVAVDRNNANKDVDFLPVVAWDKGAEFITRYFRKGERILIRGTLQTRKWTDKDNKTHVAYDIVANTAEFCERKSTEAPSAPPSAPQPQFHKAPTIEYEYDPNDDLPF